jgi:hypothetical protein
MSQSILSWFFSSNAIALADGFSDNPCQHILSWFFSNNDIADGFVDNPNQLILSWSIQSFNLNIVTKRVGLCDKL